MLKQKRENEKILQEMNNRNEQYHTSGEFHYGNKLNEAELTELQDAISKFRKLLGFEAAAFQAFFFNSFQCLERKRIRKKIIQY